MLLCMDVVHCDRLGSQALFNSTPHCFKLKDVTGVATDVCNLSTWEVETGGLPQIWGQPGVQSRTYLNKAKQNKTEGHAVTSKFI